MRILNAETLWSHGNKKGRRDIVEILETGLEAADPYHNMLKLIRVEDGKLIVGNHDFEPSGTPRPGDELYDLSKIGRVYVFGAAKGVQRAAKAIEDLLGERLAGGQVIDKEGAEITLKRIGVTLGGHPVPDEGCVLGCRRILEMCKDLQEEDLVFTIVGNGVSSLLTLPVSGVSLEDVRRATYIMQIDRGAPTSDLNPIRNHLDLMKGGRISKYLQPARAIHIILYDPDSPLGAPAPDAYATLMHHNLWLHTLPDCTTFADAKAMLEKWEAWKHMPISVREHILRADPNLETVKASEYERMRFRVFGVMPWFLGMLPSAQKKAAELGYQAHTLCTFIQAEAAQVGITLASIAKTIEREGVPFKPPCALFTNGELLVTVGKETGVGGRNQEYVLAAAQQIAGSQNIVMGAVDSDGTDGPGAQFTDKAETTPTLAGGIVDGATLEEALAAGVDIYDALRRHDTTPALWQLRSGIVATPNVGVNDLGVTLVMGSR